MLRQSLLYLSTAGWARNIATHMPIANRVAKRFVAGETLEDALNVVKALNERGIQATLDYLGESVEKAEDAQAVADTYCDILKNINKEGLQSSVSLKLTHLGYDISEELAVNNLRQILTCAQAHNIPVTIDMESSDYTENTLRIYRTMRDEYGFNNVGTVIQSYLKRTEADMKTLAQENAHIRLCKGAYLEPPTVAFPDKADVDRNFVKVTEQYLTEGDSYLCIATHDEAMIAASLDIINKHNIPEERYEFQMLHGIRSDRQQEIADAGHAVRVYVPFGTAWYPYFVRRLAERPANLLFFMRSFFR